MDFANGLNCFIGGRGTGKTTVLEFIRYAFDNLPSRDDDPEEWRRIDSLVEQNLSGGRVQVEIETKNGLVYIVSRSWDEEPVVLTADGQPTQLTLKSGSVFRADIFSQNEVERIADRSPSQLVLIDKFQPDAIVEIENELRDVQHELAANASQLLAFEVKQETIREEVATLPDVEEKLKAFTGSGGEDSEAVDQAHAAKALRDRERRAIDGIDDSLAEFEERIRSQGGWLQDQAASHLTEDILSGPNGNALSEFARRFGGCGDAVDISLRRIEDQLAEARQHIEQVNAKLAAAHDQQELAFRTLVEKHDAVMEQATERARLERERNVLLARRRTLTELTAQLDDLRRHRASLLERLSDLRDRRFAIRQAVVEQINSKVMPTVRVSLEQFGGIGAYKSLLINSLRGAEIKHNVVAEKIATSVPPRALSELVSNGDSQGLMAHAGINAAQAGKVIDSLSDREVLLSLESVDLDDKPRIELKDGETYKDSMSISKGQKCTSILPILLMDSDRPLLVDQPEDNLDNGFIYETVVTRIREVKSERQLIFVTHNPNIPVLGDASRVFVFKSNGSKGWVDKEGSVDECRNHIVTLLEGGEEAFKLRQQRYKY
ncbi:MAG: AAA family ATPase [Pirellulaceae bacterium]|nr:AAA family ATPase [Pirellulaceae bacterium]